MPTLDAGRAYLILSCPILSCPDLIRASMPKTARSCRVIRGSPDQVRRRRKEVDRTLTGGRSPGDRQCGKLPNALTGKQRIKTDHDEPLNDRKSDVQGKRGSVRVDSGG